MAALADGMSAALSGAVAVGDELLMVDGCDVQGEGAFLPWSALGEARVLLFCFVCLGGLSMRKLVRGWRVLTIVSVVCLQVVSPRWYAA